MIHDPPCSSASASTLRERPCEVSSTFSLRARPCAPTCVRHRGVAVDDLKDKPSSISPVTPALRTKNSITRGRAASHGSQRQRAAHVCACPSHLGSCKSLYYSRWETPRSGRPVLMVRRSRSGPPNRRLIFFWGPSGRQGPCWPAGEPVWAGLSVNLLACLARPAELAFPLEGRLEALLQR